ncbi:MAG TPA: RHS repeat-associated core domain-containing protein [Kofleriaceae bacterium]|nr:RHS repeat-associated core domain-containing protein [Kofleriaceae bacterium]
MRSTLGVTLGFVAALGSYALASPSDPFSVALPGRDTKPPEGLSGSSIDANVSRQHGGASYSFPIAVPPGRGGMAPHLALSYSSDAALRGGLAAGWTLAGVPEIDLDPDNGHYRYGGEILVGATGDVGAGKHFRPLVDGGLTRVALASGAWTVSTPNGVVRTYASIFGTGDGASRWELTSERDASGNTVTYNWVPVFSSDLHVDYVLKSIDYGSNTNSGLANYARVELTWVTDTCGGGPVPIGARFDNHFGRLRMYGAQRLTSIKTRVKDAPGGTYRDVTRYDLSYDPTELGCSTDRPPLRYLTKIDTVGDPSGTPLSAPPVTFTYGPKERDLSATMNPGTAKLGERGTDRGPESQLIDFDGDGINDEVRVSTVFGIGGGCRLAWRKGTYGGTFASTETETWLPSAAWAGDFNTQLSSLDSCTLNGQLAMRPEVAFGTASDPHCIDSAVEVSYRFLDWDHDGDLDLVATYDLTGPAVADGDFTPDNFVAADNDDGGTQGGCPDGSTESGTTVEGNTTVHHCSCDAGTVPNDSQDGCQACGGGSTWDPNSGTCGPDCSMFDDCSSGGWNPPGMPQLPGAGDMPGVNTCTHAVQKARDLRVYYNDQGTFHQGEFLSDGSPARLIIPTPAPVPPNGGEIQGLTLPTNLMPGLPTLVDIDGDGNQDLVTLDDTPYDDITPPGYLSSADHLNVFRGNGWSFGAAELWTLPKWSGVANGGSFVPTSSTSEVITLIEAGTMIDVNGDALPDLVFQVPNDQSTDHRTLRLYVSYNLDGSFGSPEWLGARGPTGQQRIELNVANNTMSGWRADEWAMTDLDRDGIPDLVDLVTGTSVQAASTSRAIAHLGDAGGAIALPAQWEAVERLVRSINPNAWYRTSDLVDLTGDGRADAVSFDANGYATVKTDAAGADPERLLVSIDNGRGATTRFTYGVTTSSTIASMPVGQNHPRWVVRTVTVTPGGSSPVQPAMTTTYSYGAPVYGRELSTDVAPHFLGFDGVTIDRSGQLGALSSRTVATYAYAGDPEGYETTEWTYMKQGRGLVPVKNETWTWTFAPLVGGNAIFPYADTHVTRTCDAGADQAACAAEAENVLTDHETYTSWNPTAGGPAIVYEHTQTISESPSQQHVTQRSFQARAGQSPYDASDYRLLPTSVTRKASTSTFELAKTATSYDAAGMPIDSAVIIADGIITIAAHTQRTFDANGNVLTIKRPKIVASGGTQVTTITYESWGVYPWQTTDEVGHLVKETHDMGTGAMSHREGPSKRTWIGTCGGGIPCKMSQLEPEEWSYDGLGRVTQHRIAIDPTPPAQGYTLTPSEWFSYYASASTNYTLTQRLRDIGGTTKLTSYDYTDGLGRAVAHYELTDSGAWATTRYNYDLGGGLASTVSPHPNDDASTVMSTFTRDGLGRPVQILRPDGTSQLISYDGLSDTAQESAPVEGLGPSTKTEHDPFGRLVAVHEPDGNGDHVTTYAYNAADRMTSIVDADGNTTTMSYDLAGRRTVIARGARQWIYAYDLDNQMTSVQSPIPTGGAAADYTSTTTYDSIDRPLVHTPAYRATTSTQRTDLGIGPITTAYADTGEGAGKPSTITLPFGTITYTYGVRGSLKHEQRTLTLGHNVANPITQSVDRTYNALGAPVDVTFDDGTSFGTTYDVRGLVASELWHASGGDKSVGTYHRHYAGNPDSRTNGYAQKREWTYDAMGRVVGDSIHASLGTPSWSARTYGFDGFGRLATVTGTTNGHAADADFDFDGRGRLAAATVGTTYGASMTYSPAGNVTHASVSGALDAATRDVDYVYGAVDPQAVDRLVDTNGTTFASLSYDPSGNLTSRQLPSGTETILSDGDDHIRQISAPSGTDTYFFGPGAERMVSFGPEGIKIWFGESETHLSSTGTQLLRWYHLGAGEPLARVEKLPGFVPTVELQYADALQNLIVTLSANNVVTSSFVYGAFGEVVWQSGQSNHRRQFNGKEADSTSGLRHYGYRSYDPVLLRWTAADPMYRFAPDAAWGEPQRANLYAFSMNNPMHYFDPDGRDDYTPEQTAALANAFQTVIGEGYATLASGAAWIGGNDSDWAGHEILARYLGGFGGSKYIDNDPKWTKYMMSSKALRSQVGNDIQNRFQQGLVRGTVKEGPGVFADTFHAHFSENSQWPLGKALLHGTNSTVGDFHIDGAYTASATDNGYHVAGTFTMTWNDIIDPNAKQGDGIYDDVADFMTNGLKKSYEIHISWEQPIEFDITKDGDIENWTGFDVPAPGQGDDDRGRR